MTSIGTVATKAEEKSTAMDMGMGTDTGTTTVSSKSTVRKGTDHLVCPLVDTLGRLFGVDYS